MSQEAVLTEFYSTNAKTILKEPYKRNHIWLKSSFNLHV